jgi:vitamin B12 transporter
MDYSLGETTLLTVGAVYRNDQANDNNVAFVGPPIPYEEVQSQVGGYAQLIWMVNSQLELRGGVRHDSYSDFGNEWTSNVEAIYNSEAIGLSVFAKYATSYVPPRTSDIAFDSDPATDPGPESSVSYELGLRHEWAEQNLTSELVFFHNDIDNLLIFDFTGIGFSGFDIRNVNKATTEGVEFSLDYQPSTQLNLQLGYTYLEAIDEQTNRRLVRRPRHILQLSANYQFTDAFLVGLVGTGYFNREDFELAFPFDQVDIEDYFVVGLVADWKLGEHWSVFGRVSNLLDESYAPTVGFPALGRSASIGARYAF